MGDKELLNRARNDKSAKESELSFTNPVNRVAPSLFIESMTPCPTVDWQEHRQECKGTGAST